MATWSSSPWSSRLLPVSLGYTQVNRAVLEAIHEHLPVEVETRRVLIEALHSVGYELPTANVFQPRITAEVLGLAKEFVGRYGIASRITLEAITSFAIAHRGFQVPDLFVDAVAVAYAVQLDLSAAGSFSLVDTSNYGYRLSWDSASPSTITETWRAGVAVITNILAAPVGRLVRVFSLPFGVGEVVLTDLGTVRPENNPNLGTLYEILVWNRGLGLEEERNVEEYLICKWIPAQCGAQDFFETFDDVSDLEKYSLTRTNGDPITIFDPDYISMEVIPWGTHPDGSNDNRLRATIMNVGSTAWATRSMPEQEYREFRVRWRSAPVGVGYEANHVILVDPNGSNALRFAPRDNEGSFTAVLYLSSGRHWIGTTPLITDGNYELRVVRQPDDTGSWTLTQLSAPGLPTPVVIGTGSGAMSWEWSALRFDAANQNGAFPDPTSIVFWDDIAALAKLPDPPGP